MSTEDFVGYSGVDAAARTALSHAMLGGGAKLPEDLLHIFDAFKHGSFKNPEVQLADAHAISGITCGMLKPPDAAARRLIEDNAQKAAKIVEVFFHHHPPHDPGGKRLDEGLKRSFGGVVDAARRLI